MIRSKGENIHSSKRECVEEEEEEERALDRKNIERRQMHGERWDRLFRKKVAIDEIKNGTRMVYDSRIDELCDEGTSCGFQIKKRRRRERMSISTR